MKKHYRVSLVKKTIMTFEVAAESEEEAIKTAWHLDDDCAEVEEEDWDVEDAYEVLPDIIGEDYA